MESINTCPKISIIIPSLNQGKFIRQTIDSLLYQHYPSLEIIVMDGGSVDDTIEILESFGNRIHWLSEKDDGQTQAINKGYRLCTGDIFGFLNSDDYLLPGSLAKIAEAFSDESIQWITGNYQIVDEKGKPIQSLIVFYKRILGVFSSQKLLQIVNFINQPSTFLRRTFMENVGEFNESQNYVMDYEYWLRAYPLAKLKKIKTTLSAFRIHNNSKGGSQYEKQFAEELAVVKKYTDNKLTINLHRLHNAIIVGVYKIIKRF